MTVDPKVLIENAAAFSAAYVAIKGALVKEGVAEDEAREQARSAAFIATMADSAMEGECPLCGR